MSGPNTATLLTPLNYICDVRGTIPGRYIFRWTIRGGNNCPANFDDIEVVIPDSSVTIANAGEDKFICSNTPVILNGNSFRADESAIWTVSPNTLTFNPGVTAASPIVSGFQPNTTYTFNYTITNSCGVSSKDTLIVTTGNDIGPSVANAGINQCLPLGTTQIQLNAQPPINGFGTWSQIEGPLNAIITNPNLFNTSITNVTVGTYKFLWRVEVDGCSNASFDTVTITISGNTTLANAGPDVSSCSNQFTLNGNNPQFGSGVWTQISGDGNAFIQNPFNHTSVVSNLITGQYTFRWTIYNGACPTTFDDVTITISSPPSTANAGEDQVLCGINGIATVLNANVPVSGTGQWVQVTGPNIARISNNLSASTAITGLTNGVYTFRWIIT